MNEKSRLQGHALDLTTPLGTDGEDGASLIDIFAVIPDTLILKDLDVVGKKYEYRKPLSDLWYSIHWFRRFMRESEEENEVQDSYVMREFQNEDNEIILLASNIAGAKYIGPVDSRNIHAARPTVLCIQDTTGEWWGFNDRWDL